MNGASKLERGGSHEKAIFSDGRCADALEHGGDASCASPRRHGGGHSLCLHCGDARASALVITNAAQAKETQTESKLVFNRYGNRYFLSQVWNAGSIRGRQLPISPREKEMPQLARNETKTEITLVARLSPARP